MAAPARELQAHLAVRNYTLLALGGLLLIALGLIEADKTWGALILVLVGSLALVARWSIGPPLLLVSLVCVLVGEARARNFLTYYAGRKSTLGDLELCLGVLAYVVASYRLQALVHNILPPDPRAQAAARWWAAERKRGRTGGSFPGPPPDLTAPQRRSAHLVGSDELLWLVVSFPAWVGVASVAWTQAAESRPPLGMADSAWRALVIFGTVALGLAVTAAVHGYLTRRQASPVENLLFLQDEAWRATRGEQTRINRWLTWARLRGQRRKEK